MTSESNIFPIPQGMERFAREAQAGIEMLNAAEANLATAREDRMEAALKVSIALYGARQKLKDDYEFGCWCNENNLGDNIVKKDDRAAFVQFGSNPTRTREVFARTERQSWREIYRLEWCTVSQAAKPPPASGPKLKAAKEYVQAVEALEGKFPTEQEVSDATGVSRGTASDAMRDLRSRRREEDGRIQFNKAAATHIEAAIKRRRQELEASFKETIAREINKLYNEHFPTLQKEQNEAVAERKFYREMINDHKPPFTEVEFLIILACLHPDNSASDEKRQSAFRIFNAAKFQLTGKK
jgi:hypothetical protein